MKYFGTLVKPLCINGITVLRKFQQLQNLLNAKSMVHSIYRKCLNYRVWESEDVFTNVIISTLNCTYIPRPAKTGFCI